VIDRFIVVIVSLKTQGKNTTINLKTQGKNARKTLKIQGKIIAKYHFQ